MFAFDPRPGPQAQSQTATLETEICGQRPLAARAANEPRRRSKSLSRPTAAAVSRRNVVLFCSGGNHARACGLPGGAEGIRTPDLCSAIAALSHLSYSPGRAALYVRVPGVSTAPGT